MIALLLALFVGTANAEVLTVTQFGGLNNAVDSVVIADGDAQDMLNVERNKTGTGIRKRDGYASAVSMSTSTAGIYSIFMFKNASGNEIIIVDDGDGNTKKASNFGASSTFESLTAGQRHYCQSNNGSAYCFPSDASASNFIYDGTTISSGITGYPQGKFNAFTLDRQFVSGVSGFPNRIYASKSGDFDHFTTGNTEIDAWTEDIGTSGDKITGLWYLNGRLIIGKEYSLWGAQADNQFDFIGYNISNNIGISNPEAMVLYAGMGYFKASDNEFYRIDGSPGGIEKISTKISSTTAQLLSGKTRYNIQTEYSDWAAGTATGTSYDQAIGSIEPSTVTLYDATTTQWAQGSGSYEIIIDSVVSRGLFASGSLKTWFSSATAVADSTAYISTEPSTSNVCLWAPSTATYAVSILDLYWNVAGGIYPDTTISIQNAETDAILYTQRSSGTIATSTCYLGPYFDVSTQTVSMEIRITDNYRLHTATSAQFSASDLPDGKIHFAKRYGTTVGASQSYVATYSFPYPYYQKSSTFTSRCIDSTIVNPVYGKYEATVSSNSNQAIYFHTKGSASCDGTYDSEVAVASDGRMLHTPRRYTKYMANFQTDFATQTAHLTVSTLSFASTGTYVTQCIEPGSGISAWGLTEAAGTNTCGSVSYEASTGTACGSLLPYVAFSTGAVPSVDAAAAIKYRLTFSLNSATCTARVDSITTNWSEGSAAPPSIGTYWNDGIYWGVATSGTTNNRTLKLDLLASEWYPFDLPMLSVHSFNNAIYFGKSTSGNIFKFSDIRTGLAPTSDNGASINAYWKSKDFGGGDPWTEKVLNKISLIAKKEAGGTATADWYMNGGDTGSGSYSITLSTGTNVVRNNYNVPFGATGSFWSYKVSNNSSNTFEILGVRFDYSTRPWRVLP